MHLQWICCFRSYLVVIFFSSVANNTQHTLVTCNRTVSGRVRIKMPGIQNLWALKHICTCNTWQTGHGLGSCHFFSLTKRLINHITVIDRNGLRFFLGFSECYYSSRVLFTFVVKHDWKKVKILTVGRTHLTRVQTHWSLF